MSDITSHSVNSVSVDIGHALDHGPWPIYQKLIVVLAAVAIVADGFDGQLIGFAIPVIMSEWGLGRPDFVPIVAAGLIGMATGSLLAGYIGDRVGRRAAVVGSVLVFGLATVAIGFVGSLMELGVLRFIAGLGIGGALPGATTLVAEFTPARRRTVAVTVAIVCFPLGGMIAGLFASNILPAYGWRVLFWGGGGVTVALAAVLAARLPESPRFLSRHPARWPELVALLRRMGRDVPDGAAFSDAQEQVRERGGQLRALFADGQARNTLALYGAFFLTLFAIYSVFSWLPAMLAAEGFSVSAAADGLTAYNLGGVVGAVVFALAITRWGSRWVMLFGCVGAAASALMARSLGADQAALLIVVIGVNGFFANAIQSTMYALCAHVYPTRVRTTGTATALAVGRLGAILSAFAGFSTVGTGAAQSYFLLLAMAMAGVCVALAVVRNHIPPHLR